MSGEERGCSFIQLALTICIWLGPIMFEIIAFTASLATFPWQFTPMIVPAVLMSFVLAVYAGTVTDTVKPRCGVFELNPASACVIAFYIWTGARIVNIILFAVFIRGLEPIITYIVGVVLGIAFYIVTIFVTKAK
jgi:hypothetical protein